MRKLKWTIRILALIIFGAFFHYVLPQHDIVRVVSTEVIRADFTAFNRIFYAQADSGNADNPSRDLRLINAISEDGTPMVYRNEDTGWIWPPYFKFDSSDLHAEASDAVSTAATPKWVSITHYGWRIRYLSIYPNAVAIKPVDGPQVSIIPYFNIGFFIVLAAALLFLRSMWRQFRERSVDPVLETASDKWDEVEAGVSERRSRLGRWFDSWRAKPRR
jgi:Protein of unknown function (DUF1523)